MGKAAAVPRIAGALLFATLLCPCVRADEAPPVSPDKPTAAYVTPSRVSATVEFSIPTLARDIERDVPRRLATFDERVQCVHRRVLFFVSGPIAT